MPSIKRKLIKNYNILLKHFGPQYWWPGDSDWEIMIGAVLTQNTAWSNVSKAIENLKKARSLNFNKFINLPKKELETLIRPAGYFRQKSKYLKILANHIKSKYKGSLELLFNKNLIDLRIELLNIKGIGEETADSIILYAGKKPIFVVDAYTKRILQRWGIKISKKYSGIQHLFHKNLPKNVKLFNEYHALLVALGKFFCKPKPICKACPIKSCTYIKQNLYNK
ncbi:MAG: hypothetical protein ABII27_09910 [bacterium]